MFLRFVGALLLLLTGPVLAQATPAAPSAASLGATQRLTLDTPIESIAASEAGRAILNANIPELLGHPMYPEFKAMSLNEVYPLSQGQITQAQMDKIKADLAAIK